MIVIGGVLIFVFALYEIYVSPFPLMPPSVFNNTFNCAVIVDTIYILAGGLRSTYFSSFVYTVKDWSLQNWTYFNNTLTLTLCVFGVIAGLPIDINTYKVLDSVSK